MFPVIDTDYDDNFLSNRDVLKLLGVKETQYKQYGVIATADYDVGVTIKNEKTKEQ